MAPSEGKKPRRLLSFDILSRSSSPINTSKFRPQPSKSQVTSTSNLKEDIILNDEEITTETTRLSQEIWTGIDLSEHPPMSDKNSSKASSPTPERKQQLASLRSTTPDATFTASSSRKRWEQLRQHVLPVPSRSNTPPIPDLPSGVSQTPPLTFRSQTSSQKPSRLALLGFRHVVEHAREADEALKVSQEFEKVCWSIRMADPQKLKADLYTTASSIHLAFASNISLESDGTSTVERHPHVQTKHDSRRPQSVQSLKTCRIALTVKPLYQLLLHHSNHSNPSLDRRSVFATLPHESLVLSTLLGPFLSTEESQRLEEERWNAIEAFEIIVRSWVPDNEGKAVERCLWCCKAATIPPGAMRTRILRILRGFIIPTDSKYIISTPECFQTLAQGLFSLLPHLRPLSSSPVAHEEIPLLMDVISQVCDGCCGELEAQLVQEEYGPIFSEKDDKKLIREVILLEASLRCIEDCPNDSRVWLLQHVERYWIKSPAEMEFTPLLSAIYARALHAFSRALLDILSVPLDQGPSLQRAQCASQLIQSRLIPDVDALGNAVKQEAKMNIIKVVLELICMDRAKGPVQWGLSLLHTWYRGPSVWKCHLDLTLQDIISKGTWTNIIFKISTLIRLLDDEVRKPMVTLVLPLLYDRLVDGPPPFPCISLTNLLDTVARLYPQIFYKPLFLCAASSKELSIINHLCVISIVSKFFPNFWTRDAEMVAVALMSDRGKKDSETQHKTWTKTRIGQAVVMLELIAFLQNARHEKETSSCPDSSWAETCKFIAALEPRLAILVEARERTTLLTTSQRLLFCVLLREMRLLTRSLNPAPWLLQTVGWYIDIYADDSFDREEEEKSTIGQIHGLYLAAEDGIRSTSQRRSTMFLSKSLQKPQSGDDQRSTTLADLVAMFVQRQSLLTSISKGFVRKAMKLLVTMSTLLTPIEYRRLCPYLWDLLRNDGDASLTAAVCFLIMQCAEKIPTDLSAVIGVDLQSSNDTTKLNAIYKIGILFNWRYQIISQQFVADRARRPFKVARGPLAFVSTDIGSTTYIREDDPDEMKDNLPAELRKRLVEIGWNHDDAPVDQHQGWIKVPISLLSSQQLDRLENIGPDVAPPPSPTMWNLGSLPPLTGDKIEDTGLLRRSSSTGGPIIALKRRAVFVPSLAVVLPRLASLMFDSNLAVSSAARSTLLDIMRNDPTLIGRPVLDLFAGEQKDIQSAVVILNTFLHVHKILPYPMSHSLFNNVAGFLKWASRQPEETDALQDFAHTLPILTRLVTQVSGLSIRDIRRAKIEPFLVPSGSLWFFSSAPPGSMFPRSLEQSSNPFKRLPPDLVAITTIRVSQNMLLLAMLKRNRHDVQLVRRSMSRLELPTTAPINQSFLELTDFVPSRGKKEIINPSLTGLSLMLSRSHVMLIAQIFRSMSRHLNDRNELAILIDGLNRILLVHGDDIGIVSQVIIALMVASTRFRRLFTSGGGYALFMPALIKLYTEAQDHPGIKLAIEYGANRFYALHQESFVFQTLDILAHVIALPHIDVEPLVKSIYNLFFALRRGVLLSTPDAAGIHDANRVQEREALIMNTAEEKPQTFLTLLRRNQAIGESQHLVLDLPEEYKTNQLGMDDFVRLFLTVIAHDTSIIRAEQLLRLLRNMTPHLYHASSNAREILRGGIDALATLLMKTSVKLKASDLDEGHFYSSEKTLENRLQEKSRSASNIMTMRLDYLALIISYVRAGGLLSLAAMLRTTELIRTMLREVPLDVNYGISNFIPSFIRASFMRETPPHLKVVVALLEELAPLIANYNSVIDFSSTFQTISELVASSTYSSQPRFSRAVVSCICASALSSCETAASTNILMSLPSRHSIVTLIVQCVFLRGADVVAEVEKRVPSYDYLAGVVFPLVLSLKTETIHLRDDQLEKWHRDAIRNAWIRLLSFTMSTCRKTSHLLERSRSQGRQRSNDAKQSPLPSFLIALQIIKVIVVRAGPELSSYIPGIWPRIRAFFVEILADGDAGFAINYSDVSPLPSPTNSPQSSIHLDPFQSSVSGNSLTVLHPRSFSRPRIIDYSLWSFLELLCVHRNPLILQMRFFVMEKLVGLEHDLQYWYNDLRGLHISSTVFSKPRRHVSGMLSPGSSGSSPMIASQSSPHYLYPMSSLVSLEAGRQPGYDVLSSPRDVKDPKIVHLGPISILGRTPSPGRGKELDGMTMTTIIKSVALARATYKRIRTVQKLMGYENLLPMPQNQEIDGDDVPTTMWTETEALDAIARETDELLEEFDELARSLEDESGLMDLPETGLSRQ